MDVKNEQAMDREELVALVSEHYQYVRKVAWTMVNNKDDFDDLANEAIVDALEGLDTLREPEYIKSWLYTIVRNEAKAYYAQNERRKKIEDRVRLEAGSADLADLSEFAAGEAAFREMMQRAEEADLAREIMTGLDSIYRSIMYMRFWGGYKFSEIGEIVNVKEVTVRSMYARCRDRLCEKYQYIGKEADSDDR